MWKTCGKNNFPQHMVCSSASSHTIYGVSLLDKTKCLHSENQSMHIRRVLLGCLIIGGAVGFLCSRACGLCILPDVEARDAIGIFLQMVVRDIRFLLPLVLLAYVPLGPRLVPLIFCLEGLMLGAAAGACSVSVLMLLVPPVTLILPFGLLVGSWSCRRSHLGEPLRIRLVCTALIVCGISALASCLLLSAIANEII